MKGGEGGKPCDSKGPTWSETKDNRVLYAGIMSLNSRPFEDFLKTFQKNFRTSLPPQAVISNTSLYLYP